MLRGSPAHIKKQQIGREERRWHTRRGRQQSEESNYKDENGGKRNAK